MSIAVVLLACLATGYYLFGPVLSNKQKPKLPVGRASRYHAVSLESGNGACRAVKVFGNRRFLAASAPQLPVRDCKAGKCQCRYVHHDDRRAPVKRRARFSPETELYSVGGQTDRRRLNGRRSSDLLEQGADDFGYDDIEWNT